jgi:flagellin
VEANTALVEALKTTDMANTFDISGTANVVFEVKTAGSTQAGVIAADVNKDITGTTVANVAATKTTLGANSYNSIDITALKAWTSSTAPTNNTTKTEEALFTIDGKKFAFVNSGELAAAKVAFGEDVTLIEDSAATDVALVNTDAAKLSEVVNIKLGYEAAKVNGTTDTQVDFKEVASKPATSTKGLTLQIGDSAETFNQLTVQVGDMHAKALGIDAVDIGTQAGAAAAMDKIKTAINSVSSTRGDLGALQNRLDHTINNLAVMTENIQDAEATIRDTDVAEEMMAYTKNNILVQSAQAMLAQANQLPQGVLQLLG